MSPKQKHRVLNLIDPLNPSVGPCVLTLLADLANASSTAEVDLAALIIGPASAEQLAHDLDLPTCDRIGAHGRSSWLAVDALRRFLSRSAPFDLVHAWSLSAGTLAALAAPSVPRLITLNLNPPSTSPAHWLRTLMSALPASTTVVALSNAVKRSWIQHGAPAEAFHVIHPGIDLKRVDLSTRDQRRRRWGIPTPQTAVLGLLGQPGRRCDACRAARILAMAHLSGLDVAIVCDPQSHRLEAGRAAVRGAGCADRFITDGDMPAPWRVLPGIDVALIIGDDSVEADDVQHPREPQHASWRSPRTWLDVLNRVSDPGASWRRESARVMPGVLPMHWAAAAGKAIVAEASYAVLETIEPGKTALLATPGDDNAIVQRLHQLQSDPQLAWSIRDRASSEAYSFFSVSRFCTDVVATWNQIIQDQPVTVSQIPMTGGLAFSQRG